MIKIHFWHGDSYSSVVPTNVLFLQQCYEDLFQEDILITSVHLLDCYIP